jgi:RHS repeat-associated protein
MYDGGGSVRQLTNSLGAVTDEYEYDAFGNSFTRSGTTPNNYLYRGEQFDSDLGLYYLRARYYNPATGRFMSRDPENGIITDPKTLHKYDYAGGDPVNLKDPTGREDDLVDEGLIYRAGIIAILATTTIYGRNDLAQIACDAIAWLNGGVLELTGYEDITFNYANCSAEGKREKCKPGEDNHHMLPQEFIKFFKACDIPDISAPQYMRCVPRDCHTGPGGLHSNQNGKGTNWNGRWATWISGWEEKGICPALPQVLGFMDKLEQEFARQFICAGEEE